MDADHWDRRYAEAAYVWKTAPNQFVVAETAPLTPGRALDLACGEGRNAVWLAEQGWQVTGIDFSAVGLDKGRRLAGDHHVDVDWQCADVVEWQAPAAAFDLVLLAYLQVAPPARRQALANAVTALAPGGVLLVVAHDRRNLSDGVGGPQDPQVLYGPTDVVTDLAQIDAGVVVERADTVERTVDGADRPALDCLVRARREAR